MNYEHLPLGILEDLRKMGKLPSSSWTLALKAHGQDPDKTPPLLRVQRDKTLRLKTKNLDPMDLWTDEGDPSPLALHLISWGYFPHVRRLIDWIEWCDLEMTRG